MPVDTDTADARMIDHGRDCGVNMDGLHDSFMLHDNDLATHVFLPYLLCFGLDPWLAVIISYLYESISVLRVAAGDDHDALFVYTGATDGLLQDPGAAFIGVFFFWLQCRSLGFTPRRAREYMNTSFRVNWGAYWPSSGTFNLLLFSWVPFALFHSSLEAAADINLTHVPFRISTMIFSAWGFVIQAMAMGHRRDTLVKLIMGTYMALLLASLVSYLCFDSDQVQWTQSTFIWVLVAMSIESVIIHYRTSPKGADKVGATNDSGATSASSAVNGRLLRL